jgi:hypothetical protein
MNVPTWNRCTISPCLCRILGKTWDESLGRTRPWTDNELMEKTGWGRRHLRAVYRAATWQDVTSGDIDLFLWACGIKPSKQRRSVWMLERIRRAGEFRQLRHLRPATGWLENQIRALLKMVEKVGNESNHTSRD